MSSSAAADANCSIHWSPPTGNHRQPKMRRVRKGTQSCWECKRRKIRCTFSAPTEAICEGCKRRQTKCISQEFPDESSLGSRSVEQRLDRVESMLEQLAAGTGSVSRELPHLASPYGRDFRDESEAWTNHAPSIGTSAAASAAGRVSTLPSSPGCENTKRDQDTTSTARPLPPQTSLASAAVVTPGRHATVVDRYDELSHSLFAAWPSQHDLELILKLPIDLSGLWHGAVCTRYDEDGLTLQDILEPPPSGAHPVLIARKLLILGTLLQGVSPGRSQQSSHLLDSLSTGYLDLMSRAVETAYSLVVCNDDLVDSIEGIECIAMEAMYQNNAGNLRRAWMAIRRAMLIAQMRGLHRSIHRSIHSSSPPGLGSTNQRHSHSEHRSRADSEHRSRAEPALIWFRLVQSDRYLSLMLGLPQYALEDSFAASKVLEECTPIERMQRMVCVAGGRVLQRNQAEMHDLLETQQIDQLLQTAAALMPPQWWLIPRVSSNLDDRMASLALRDTIRLMDQFAYYHLTVQLHLPYLLRYSTDHRYDYHRLATVHASREVLARFVSFRDSGLSRSYCRGIDFLAFIASTTLSIAHIDASNRRHTGIGNRSGPRDTVTSILALERLTDRGMMECVLESMDQRAKNGSDLIATKIASILRHLLIIEADVVTGDNYHAALSSEDDEEELGCRGRVSNDGHVLLIQIPYFGTVKIERGGLSRSNVELPIALEDGFRSTSPAGTSNSNPVITCEPTLAPELAVECEQDFSATSGYPMGYRISDRSINPDWQAVPSKLDTSDSINTPSSQLLVPGLTADTDDWALQGVEMTVFDSLIRGSTTEAG